MAKQKQWMGTVPQSCEICDDEIKSVFYDMKTKMGPWGMLCKKCALHGAGVGKTGVGLGQKYEKQPDGKWIKTEG